jgi:hypothetical protein
MVWQYVKPASNARPQKLFMLRTYAGEVKLYGCCKAKQKQQGYSDKTATE